MPNIFDGIRKISDKDLIEQIALLEVMNVTNISKPIIQEAKRKTISVINFLGNKIGRKEMIEEPEVKEIWTLVDEKKEELKSHTRAELDERLLDIIKEKSKNDMTDFTEDEISIEVIEEAAKLYKLRNSATPAQKADFVYLKYCEKLNERAKEYMDEQTFVGLQEATEYIEEILNNMNKEQTKDFLESVDVKEVTLLNVWKKLDRQHFGRLVWLSVKSCDGRFTPKEEVLPSFIENQEDNKVTKQEENIKKLQEELLALENRMQLSKNKVTSIENKLKEESILLNNAIDNKKKDEQKIIDLKKTNVKLQEVQKNQEEKLNKIKGKMENAVVEKLDLLMEEFKKVKFEAIDVKNKLYDIDLEVTYKNKLIKDNTKKIENKQKALKQIDSELQKSKLDNDSLIKIYNDKKKENEKNEEQKKNDIFERWSKSFNKITFRRDNLANVINFSLKELLLIEECLYELNFTKDPMAMSIGTVRGKDDKGEKVEYQYIDVSYHDNFEFEIQYIVLDNKEKNIEVVEITTEF